MSLTLIDSVSFDSWASERTCQQMKLADRLHQLGSILPLLVWGENNHWQIADWAHKRHEAILGRGLEILPSCSHLVPEGQPEHLSEPLIQFISDNI